MITLIATGHRENGLCNTHELYKIIEQVAPDIIFEEVPPNIFAAVYEGRTRDSLETYTIKKYLEKYPIAHYPVDLDTKETTSKQFRNEVNQMFDLFAYHSTEYNELSDQHSSLVSYQGFPYLNSDRCKELLDRKHFLEENILKSLNHERLSQAYKAWLSFINKRRDEMIRNIYSCTYVNRNIRALFLVGAEHRQPIIDKIPKFEKANQLDLNWIFNFFS